MLKKKLSKLILSADDQEILEVEAMIAEDRKLMAALKDAKRDLRQATGAFVRALDRLNSVNARLNRGPVEIEDELFHHCPSQATFNQRYADANARYHAKLAKSLPTIDANERQQ